MKKYITILFVFLILPFIVKSQEDGISQENDSISKKVKEKLERSAFESSYIIDNPTNIVLNKKALEVQMQHRFGSFNDDQNNGAGLWGSSNIRIGLAYGIHERVTIGVGTTKDKRYQDFNWKGAILRQTRSKKMPLSVTYYGNFTISALPKEQFQHTEDRWSFFNQLIVARRFSPEFSAQGTISISHFNIVDNTMRNDMVAFSLGGRYKITPNTAIMIDYSQPLTEFLDANPHPGLSFGVEFGTSAHAFQLFISNYHGIVPQDNYMFNNNDIVIKDMFIGFNITRSYNF